MCSDREYEVEMIPVMSLLILVAMLSLLSTIPFVYGLTTIYIDRDADGIDADCSIGATPGNCNIRMAFAECSSKECTVVLPHKQVPGQACISHMMFYFLQ